MFKKLIITFILSFFLVGLIPSAAASAASASAEGYATAAADSSEEYEYFVEWDFAALVKKTPGNAYDHTAPDNTNFAGDLVHVFGFPYSVFKSGARGVLCDTYITFYTKNQEDLTLTSANDMRGKGQVEFVANYNFMYDGLRIHEIYGKQWEISKRFYNYLTEVQADNDYVVSIAIYTSQTDRQFPMSFPDAMGTNSLDKSGTKLNFTLSREANEDYIPIDDTGDFTDTSGKGEEGITDESGELGGDATTEDPEATGRKAQTALTKIAEAIADFFNTTTEKITKALKIIGYILIAVVGLLLLAGMTRLIKLIFGGSKK